MIDAPSLAKALAVPAPMPLRGTCYDSYFPFRVPVPKVQLALGGQW
jgi:hypothetical protein